jgi:hypothetical protein
MSIYIVYSRRRGSEGGLRKLSELKMDFRLLSAFAANVSRKLGEFVSFANSFELIAVEKLFCLLHGCTLCINNLKRRN